VTKVKVLLNSKISLLTIKKITIMSNTPSINGIRSNGESYKNNENSGLDT
jgi:hypothetical protein